MTKFTAQELASKNGHRFLDSTTVLKTAVNPAGTTTSGGISMMELRVCGTETESFFEWVDAAGKRVGDFFEVIDEENGNESSTSPLHWSLKTD